MSEGFLIAFEGGDRCGKTTQLQKLYEYLTAKGRDVVQLKHPDRGTVIGHIIDSFLRKQIRLSNEVATLLLTANLWENQYKA
jgi:dTMP kinase